MNSQKKDVGTMTTWKEVNRKITRRDFIKVTGTIVLEHGLNNASQPLRIYRSRSRLAASNAGLDTSFSRSWVASFIIFRVVGRNLG